MSQSRRNLPRVNLGFASKTRKRSKYCRSRTSTLHPFDMSTWEGVQGEGLSSNGPCKHAYKVKTAARARSTLSICPPGHATSRVSGRLKSITPEFSSRQSRNCIKNTQWVKIVQVAHQLALSICPPGKEFKVKDERASARAKNRKGCTSTLHPFDMSTWPRYVNREYLPQVNHAGIFPKSVSDLHQTHATSDSQSRMCVQTTKTLKP